MEQESWSKEDGAVYGRLRNAILILMNTNDNKKQNQ